MNQFTMASDDDPSGEQLLLIVHVPFSLTSARYNAKSVLAGLSVSLGGSLVLLIFFCFIRPRHNLIYAPRLKFAKGERKPEPLGNNPIAWLQKMFTIKEEELVDQLGLDAAVFIRFLAMCRNMFLFMAVLASAVIIPVNVYYNMQSKYATDLSKSDAFILMTPSLISGYPLAAHAALGWIFDGFVVYLLYRNYTRITELKRNRSMAKEYQRMLFMRTLLVTEIPERLQTDQGLCELATGWHTDKTLQQINVGRNTKQLTKLIESHMRVVLLLEKVLAKYLRNPDRLPAKRPMVRPMKADRNSSPRHVDAIDYYVSKMQTLEDQIIDARQAVDSRDCLSYGFLSYDTPADCHLVAEHLKNKRRDGVLARLAPRPEDIIWYNMVMTRLERGSKQFWGNLFYVMMLVAWIVPNAFIGCFLADLQRIGTLWHPFQTFADAHSTLFAIIQGFISPVVTTLIFLILPMLLRRVSQWQGKMTKNERERDVTHKLYIFFFFNNLFVFTLIGVGWNIALQLVTLKSNNQLNSFSQVMDQLRLGRQLASAIINASAFWVMYVLKAYLGAILDLLQAATLIWDSFQQYALSPTPRQLRNWMAPQAFNYAAYYNWHFFYVTIGLCFTIIQPVITPILAFFFTFDVALKRYMLMYMFVTKVESDGRFWPLAHDSILWAAGVGNLILLCVVWIQGGFDLAMAVVPLPFLLIAYKIFTNFKLKPRFNYFVPDGPEQEMMEFQNALTKAQPRGNVSMLEQRYANPALTSALPAPMVHARAEHLLPSVLGRGGMACRVLGSAAGEQGGVGPTKFDVVQENEISYAGQSPL